MHTFRSPEFVGVVDKAIQFLKATPVHSLPPSSRFTGVGVYVLYYMGTFDLYKEAVLPNEDECTQPIYVGKAVPQGWRTARVARDEELRTLYGRLGEHARSIEQAENLGIDDFRCRFMILEGVETDLVTLVEAELIRRFNPLWNTVVDGFGNHDPGKGRYNQARSERDVMHPGRSWVERLTGESPTLADIITKIERAR